eukprot:EG_transcript_14033
MWKSQFHRSKQDEHVESYSGDANEDEAWGRKYEGEVVSVSLKELRQLRDQLQNVQQENSLLKEQIRRLLDAEKALELRHEQQLASVTEQLRTAGEAAAAVEAKVAGLQEEKDRACAERDRAQAALVQARTDFEALVERVAPMAAVPSPQGPSLGLAPQPWVSGSADPPAGPHGADLFLTPAHSSPVPPRYASAPPPGPPSDDGLRHGPPAPSSPPQLHPPSQPAAIAASPPHRRSPTAPPLDSPGVWGARPTPPVQEEISWAGMELFNVIGLEIEVRAGAHDADEGVVHVVDVRHASLAEKAGLRIGDRIDKWNYRYIEDAKALRDAVHKTAPGSRLRVSFFRKGIRKQTLIDVP